MSETHDSSSSSHKLNGEEEASDFIEEGKKEAEKKFLKLVFMLTIQQYPLSLKFNQH
jgi:hypothetical protein